MPPTPTSRRASIAERPDTHATTAYRLASAARARVASGGTRASSARSTIGARVPSMSHSTAARSGASVSGRSASASMSAVGAATRRSMPAMSSRLLRLAIIGSAAGAFSGLFGVGGGTVIVPLLILWFSFEEREATGTSLAAIVIVAAMAAAIQGLHGHVHVVEGLDRGRARGGRGGGRHRAPAADSPAGGFWRVRGSCF